MNERILYDASKCNAWSTVVTPEKPFRLTARATPHVSMEEVTLREIAVNSAYQLGFYCVMRRAYNSKEYGYVRGYDEAKIATLVNVLRSLLAGCPQFSREVAVWIKKGIEGARQ